MPVLSQPLTPNDEDFMNELFDTAAYRESLIVSVKSQSRRKMKSPKTEDSEDRTPLDLRPDGIYLHDKRFQCERCHYPIPSIALDAGDFIYFGASTTFGPSWCWIHPCLPPRSIEGEKASAALPAREI